MSEGHFRGFGARGTTPVPINTDDLVEDIARARDSSTGEQKKLWKRVGRRIERLEVAMKEISARAIAVGFPSTEDE